MNSNLKATEDLILRHLGDGLSADEQRSLAARLEKSEKARQLLASYLRMEAGVLRLARGQGISQPSLLADTEGKISISQGSTPTVAGRSSAIAVRWKHLVGLASATAAAIILAVSLWPLPESPNQPTIESAPAVAYLNRVIDVRWQGEDRPHAGTAMRPQRLSLIQGVAEIEFVNGATVILEGPAEFDLVSADCGFLRHGRLRSIVPPDAFGFTISSTAQTIVDLGTEFGFDVEKMGAAEVHVFDGEVEIYKGSEAEKGTPQLLVAGEALRFEPGGERLVMLADSSAFVGQSSLELRAVALLSELDDRFRSVQKQQRILARREKQLLAEIRQSPELKDLRVKAEHAASAVLDAARGHKAFQRAENDRLSARKQLKDLVEQKLAESEEGRAALQLRRELDGQIDAITKLRDSEADRDTKLKTKATARALRTAVRERERQSQLLRTLRQHIRKNDKEVRECLRRFSMNRRAVNEAMRRSVVGELRQQWTSSRRRYLKQLKKVMREHPRLREIREERKALSAKMQTLRKQMHDANQDTATTA